MKQYKVSGVRMREDGDRRFTARIRALSPRRAHEDFLLEVGEIEQGDLEGRGVDEINAEEFHVQDVTEVR